MPNSLLSARVTSRTYDIIGMEFPQELATQLEDFSIASGISPHFYLRGIKLNSSQRYGEITKDSLINTIDKLLKQKSRHDYQFEKQEKALLKAIKEWLIKQVKPPRGNKTTAPPRG